MRSLLILLCSLSLVSCSIFEGSQDVAPCLKENQQSLMIEWGTYADYERRTGGGFELTSHGELIEITVTADTTSDRVAWIAHGVYCSTAEDVMSTFLKVQALHSPGARGRYIRYSNPSTGVYLQAVWNPDLETFQSRDMRRLFDELMRLVPTDAE